jgi:hypothetical protein
MPLSEILQIAMMTQHNLFIKFIRKRLSALRSAVSDISDEGYEISGQMYEVSKHVFRTGMSRARSKLNCNKISLAYEIRPEPEAEYFVHLRRIYNRLCDAVQIVNSMFGFIWMFVIIQIFTVLITGVNTVMALISEDLNHKFYDQTSMIVYTVSHIVLSLGTLVTTIVSCHVTVLESKELGNEVGKLLLKYPLRSDTVQQLKLFLFQISNNDVQFTAFWLFNLDISFLCTIFASSITYIVLLAQLK